MDNGGDRATSSPLASQITELRKKFINLLSTENEIASVAVQIARREVERTTSTSVPQSPSSRTPLCNTEDARERDYFARREAQMEADSARLAKELEEARREREELRARQGEDALKTRRLLADLQAQVESSQREMRERLESGMQAVVARELNDRIGQLEECHAERINVLNQEISMLRSALDISRRAQQQAEVDAQRERNRAEEERLKSVDLQTLVARLQEAVAAPSQELDAAIAEAVAEKDYELQQLRQRVHDEHVALEQTSLEAREQRQQDVRALQEAERKTRDVERRLQDAERRCQEAERRSQEADKKLREVSSANDAKNQRAAAAEAAAADRLRALEAAIRDREEELRAPAASEEIERKIQEEREALEEQFVGQRVVLENKLRGKERQVEDLSARVKTLMEEKAAAAASAAAQSPSKAALADEQKRLIETLRSRVRELEQAAQHRQEAQIASSEEQERLQKRLKSMESKLIEKEEELNNARRLSILANGSGGGGGVNDGSSLSEYQRQLEEMHAKAVSSYNARNNRLIDRRRVVQSEIAELDSNNVVVN